MSFATPEKQCIKNDKQRVTFATTECIRRGRATPHTKKSIDNKPRLIESGAVRLQFDAKTNPRRNKNHIGSHRLIDQGAVRLNITRHTTPRRRRIHKSRSQLYSPELLTRKKMVPQSDKLYRRKSNDVSIAATTSFTPANTPAVKKYTPNRRRSNAHRGGHRFRASLSPKPPSKILLHSTPINTMDNMQKENNNDNLAFELHRRLVEHSAIMNEQQEEAKEESLPRMLF